MRDDFSRMFNENKLSYQHLRTEYANMAVDNARYPVFIFLFPDE